MYPDHSRNPNPLSTKRSRLERETVVMRPTSNNTSIHMMLSVPPDLIFRESQEKPLLTRAEGQCFMRINLVAQEMDAMVLLAENMLVQRKEYQLMRHKLHECQNPVLHAVAVIAGIFENTSLPPLQVIQKALRDFMIELSSHSSVLRQSAEHNRSFSASLLDANGGNSSQRLALDKRKIAELEEEICRRIDGLVAITWFDYQEDKIISINTKKALGAKRKLFDQIPQSARDLGNESMKNVYYRIFESITKASTQPDGHHTPPSQDTDEFEHGKQVEESQNSFLKKSSAAEVLANLVTGQQM